MQRNRPRNQSDRVIFNGHDLSSLVYCKINRPLMPPVEASFEAVPGRHGEVFKRSLLKGYDLPVEIWLRSEHRRDVAEIRHQLAAMLWTDEPSPLRLPDDPTRYLMAVVSGDTDLGEITDDCPQATVTFHVGDPVYYGQKRRVEVSAGNAFVNAGGTWPSSIRVTAKPGAVAKWRITNADTGEFVALEGSFSSSTTIGVDMGAERATINNQNAPVTIDSDFFEISGRTHLVVSSGTAVLEWVVRWL
mgnify:FL=1